LDSPGFAVVIPVHNKERHIARTIESVERQTLAPDQVVIVDDASSDGSMAIVRARADERTVLLRRDEPGPGGYAARNLAIERASAQWIAFLDADDSWTPDHLASLAAAVARGGEDVGCVFSGYSFIEPSGLKVDDWFTRSGRAPGVFRTDDMLRIWLEGGCPMWTGAVAIRRQILLDVGMFPAGLCRRGGDRDLWLRTMLATACAYTGTATAAYHRDADNMLTKVETFAVRQRILDSIAEQTPKADAPTAALLRRIANREMGQYAFKAWKAGARIDRAMWHDYAVGAGPLRYLAIRAMATVPFPLSQAARGRVRDLKASLRRRRAGAAP
jgi:glycosyltransferase involved in cell wall biosynthesis